jgi:hypothetical protein
MCDALEVAPLALFAPPWENSTDIHIIKNNIWKTQKKMEWRYVAQY